MSAVLAGVLLPVFFFFFFKKGDRPQVNNEIAVKFINSAMYTDGKHLSNISLQLPSYCAGDLIEVFIAPPQKRFCEPGLRAYRQGYQQAQQRIQLAQSIFKTILNIRTYTRVYIYSDIYTPCQWKKHLPTMYIYINLN